MINRPKEMMSIAAGIFAASLGKLGQRLRPKPVMMSKPKKEDNWKSGSSVYVRGRDYSASIMRSKYLPHQSTREKERRKRQMEKQRG